MLAFGKSNNTQKISNTVNHHRGYVNDLIKYCQSQHLLAYGVPLTEILIEPRFIFSPPMVAPIDENLTQSVFFNVPTVWDYPFMHSNYNILTESVEDFDKSAKHVALIGLMGSGRTTALFTLALWSLGQVSFPIEKDVIQKRIDEEERDLSAEERAKRVKNRVLLMQQFRESIKEDQEKTYQDALTEKKTSAQERKTLRNYAPMYIHLGNLILKDNEYGNTIDPAEPFVRALQTYSSYVTARTMPRTIYSLLESGQALVLIDGLDDLPHEEQEPKLEWLRAFMARYGKNFIVFSAPLHAKYRLTQLGFSCTHLRPWNETMAQQYTEKVVAHWQKLTRGSTLSAETRLNLLRKSRFLSPFDYTLRLLAQDEGYESDHAINYLKLAHKLNDEQLQKLVGVATLEMQDKVITVKRLVEIETKNFSIEIEKQLSQITDEKEHKAKKAQLDTEKRKVARAQKKILQDLTKTKLITRFRRGNYRFTSRHLSAFFRAQNLTEVDYARYHNHPDWALVMCYAQQLDTPFPDYGVIAALNSTNDFQYSDILKLTQWLRYNNQEVGWRAIVLKTIANKLVAPHQYTVIRERIAAAMVSMGNNSVVTAFRKMTQNPNADVRRIGNFALGAMKDLDAIKPLIGMAQNDPDESVQTSAALALGAIATDRALKHLAELLHNSENADVQRASAESLSLFPDAGYPVLYDALNSKATMVRRSTTWALGRLRTDWSLIVLLRTRQSDKQWEVRSAAEQVFIDVYEQGKQGVIQYPALDDIEWLKNWMYTAIKTQGIPNNLTGSSLLSAALEQHNDLLVQLMSTILSGQFGVLEMARLLYLHLSSQEESIRDAAYRSLCDLEQGWGIKLPSLIQ
jgi:HEAT repeat protein